MALSPNTVPIDLLKAAGAASLAVASTGTARSNSFLLDPKKSFSLEVQLAVDSGTPNVKMEMEVGGSVPGTEGSADDNFTIPRALGGAINPDSTIDSGINTVLVRFYPLPPVVGPFQRFLFTGVGLNPATCRVAKLIVHEIES